MNILQILPELNVGGVETGTLDLAKYLVKSGHKAVVVSAGGQLVKDLESLGGIHYQLAVNEKSIISMVKMVPRLAEIIKKENIDIVHARSRVPAWIAYFACRKTSAVFITTCHGYYSKHPLSYVMGWGRRVIVPSNVIARHMIDDFGVAHERIKLIPRSVDLERFKYSLPVRKPAGKFNVGIIGRITPLKGHMYFIKAMAKASRVIPGLKIWIVGDAPSSKDAYKEQLKILVKRLGLSSSTDFLGNQKDVPQILKNLDLLVLSTTTHEAFGRVIIEAQACGVPVVATSVGGVNDIIDDGRTGLLVPPGDPESMAEAVLKIFNSPGLATELSEAAYRKVKEKYSVELMVKDTVNVYNDAIQNHKALVIKISSLGDIILSTASIRALKEKLKNYKISVLVSEESKEVFLRSPYIDELLVCDFKGRDKGLLGLLKLSGYLRRKGFDAVIDLQNSRKSHLLAFLSLAPFRYGYDNKKFGFLLNRSIKDDKALIDPVQHQLRVLKMLGVDSIVPKLQLCPTEADKRYVDEFLSSQWLAQNQKILGINMSASKRWNTKIWPMKNLVKLCEELGSRDIRVVLTGTDNDSARAAELIKSVSNIKPINACGKTTINQLACLIHR
ncbi:glycosyltransferase, partial [bacterium]